MKNDSVAIGVIGAGIMGERLLNAILQQDSALVRACGLWDPAPEAMRRMAKAFPRVPRLADAASVIAASDCTYIASPPASHLVHARAALAAGKSVFCEKPLAVDVADARAFVAEAGPRGAVNFPFASSPAVATLRSWLEAGEIGTPLRIAIEVGFAKWPRLLLRQGIRRGLPRPVGPAPLGDRPVAQPDRALVAFQPPDVVIVLRRLADRAREGDRQIAGLQGRGDTSFGLAGFREGGLAVQAVQGPDEPPRQKEEMRDDLACKAPLHRPVQPARGIHLPYR